MSAQLLPGFSPIPAGQQSPGGLGHLSTPPPSWLAETQIVPASQNEGDADGDADGVRCIKCNCVIDPLMAIIKHRNDEDMSKSKYICRPCNCLCTMLHRQMEWPPAHFEDLAKEDQQNFFALCRTNQEGNRFQYSKIRALLQRTLVKSKTKTDEAEVLGESFPLGVWEKMGYDPEKIKEGGIEEDHPVLGKCYKLFLAKERHTVSLAEADTIILRAEQKITNKKRALPLKGKASKADAGENDGNNANADDDDDVVDLLDSSSESERGSNKKPKVDLTDEKAVQKAILEAKKKKKAAEKAAELERKKIEAKEKQDKAKAVAAVKKQNANLSNLATKAVAAMNAVLNPMKEALELVEANGDENYPASQITELKDACKTIDEWFVAAEATVKAAKEKTEQGKQLDALPFDAKTLAAKVKSAKDYVKQFHIVHRAIYNAK